MAEERLTDELLEQLLASASPEEKRRKFTLMPVSFVKAAKTWEAYFSGMME